jgi:hypothetical protein
VEAAEVGYASLEHDIGKSVIAIIRCDFEWGAVGVEELEVDVVFLRLIDYHSFVWSELVVGETDSNRGLFAPVFFLKHKGLDHECLAGNYDFEVEAAVWTADNLSLQSIFWDCD